MKNVITNLIKFQSLVPAIPKTKENPFFIKNGKKSMYADLSTVIEVCKPILNKCDLAVMQTMFVQDGRNCLRTILADISGETVASDIFLPDIQDPQKLTAAVTYFRRCQYLSILGLVAEEDDDGNSVGTQEPKKECKHSGGQEFPASDKQLGMIKSLCRRKNYEPQRSIVGISAKDADVLIKKLMAMADVK